MPELESHPSRHLAVSMQVFRTTDQKLKHFGMDTCDPYLMCLLWAGKEGREAREALRSLPPQFLVYPESQETGWATELSNRQCPLELVLSQNNQGDTIQKAGWGIIQSHIALKILLHSLKASGRKRTRLTDPGKNPKLTDTLVTGLRNCPHGLIPQHTGEQREAKNREVWCSGATACREGETQVQTFPAQSPCPSPSLPCSGLIYKVPSFPRSFTLSY